MARFAAHLLLVVGALSIGCNSRPRRVVIGVAVTPSHHSGVQLAVKEINASGGLNGVPIELMGLDWHQSRFDSVEILKWADRFSEENDLLAVVGHSDSASTLTAAAVYNQKRVPQIVTIATNPAITNIGDWTYRLCLSDAVQGPALAEYAIREWNKRRIVIFYVNDAYGRALTQIFENRARELGGEILASVMHRNTIRPDDKELIRLTLKRTKEMKPDLFVLFQRLDAALWTLGAIKDSGFQSDFLGGDSLGPIQFVRADPKLTEGMRVSQFFAPTPDDSRANHFIEALKEIPGEEADYARALAYDAVFLIRDAVLNGGYTRKDVKNYLDQLIRNKTRVEGAGGPYVLGPDHDGRRALFITEIHNGGHRLLKTIEATPHD